MPSLNLNNAFSHKKGRYAFVVVLFSFLIPLGTPTLAAECPSSKEFITTLEYLRTRTELKLAEPQSILIAKKVSKGCTHAAKRFTQIFSGLTGAGVAADRALQYAQTFAEKSSPQKKDREERDHKELDHKERDMEAEVFLSLFFRAYAEDDLDLTLSDSLHLAHQLVLEGDFKNAKIVDVRNDFEKVVRACVREKEMNLPRPQCADLATRITQLGKGTPGGLADTYLEMIRFLESESGPHLTQGDALPLAEKLLRGGKNSSQNLSQAYRYAVSSSGLSLPTREALMLAQELVLTSSEPSELKSK